MTTTPDAVVIGYGPVGASVTAALLEQGQRVRVVTRSGSGPQEAERVAADAADHHAIARAIDGGAVVHMCFHAPYSAKAWAAMLPGMEAGVLNAARTSGATVITAESLYAFDADAGAMSERTALKPRSRKGEVRRTLIEARAASGARVVSVVAGDFYGPRVMMAHAGERMMTPLLAGKTLRPVGQIDLPHAFTHVPDLAAAMVRASTLDGVGHELVMAPNAGSLTMRQLATITAMAAGIPTPRLAPFPQAMMSALGLVMPSIREIAEMGYQFTQPFEVDASAGERRLGLRATPWAEAATETVAWWRERTLKVART